MSSGKGSKFNGSSQSERCIQGLIVSRVVSQWYSRNRYCGFLSLSSYRSIFISCMSSISCSPFGYWSHPYWCFASISSTSCTKSSSLQMPQVEWCTCWTPLREKKLCAVLHYLWCIAVFLRYINPQRVYFPNGWSNLHD